MVFTIYVAAAQFAACISAKHMAQLSSPVSLHSYSRLQMFLHLKQTTDLVDFVGSSAVHRSQHVPVMIAPT